MNTQKSLFVIIATVAVVGGYLGIRSVNRIYLKQKAARVELEKKQAEATKKPAPAPTEIVLSANWNKNSPNVTISWTSTEYLTGVQLLVEDLDKRITDPHKLRSGTTGMYAVDSLKPTSHYQFMLTGNDSTGNTVRSEPIYRLMFVACKLEMNVDGFADTLVCDADRLSIPTKPTPEIVRQMIEREWRQQSLAKLDKIHGLFDKDVVAKQ